MIQDEPNIAFYVDDNFNWILELWGQWGIYTSRKKFIIADM